MANTNISPEDIDHISAEDGSVNVAVHLKKHVSQSKVNQATKAAKSKAKLVVTLQGGDKADGTAGTVTVAAISGTAKPGAEPDHDEADGLSTLAIVLIAVGGVGVVGAAVWLASRERNAPAYGAIGPAGNFL